MKNHNDAEIVSDKCECSVRHVNDVWRTYNKKGVAGIIEKPTGRPSNSGALTLEQQKEIQKCLIDKNPNQLKLPGCLWNRSNIQGLIKSLYKIELTLQAISKYLKKWGFTPQRPVKKNYKQNPEEVNKWLEEEYPEIERRSKNENAEVHWGDETGCQNESNYIKGYAPKGQTPVLEVGNEKIKVNMISSITNRGKLRFMFYRERMDGKMFIKFMRRLIKDSPKKIFFIIDNQNQWRTG
jgi:transposase